MIVCATPRCGGTVFCIDKAAEMGATFVGELSPDYIKGIGRYGSLKQANHETAYQPLFELDDYLEHLGHVQAADRIYLVNEAVSLALPSSSFRVATRKLDRAFRSMADLVIRSTAGEDPQGSSGTAPPSRNRGPLRPAARGRAAGSRVGTCGASPAVRAPPVTGRRGGCGTARAKFPR